MRNGVAVGKSDTAIANVLVGERRIVDQVNIGSMMSIIAGIIIVCVSLISVQAAPIEMKIDPNNSTPSNAYSTNEATRRGLMTST